MVQPLGVKILLIKRQERLQLRAESHTLPFSELLFLIFSYIS